MQLGCNLKSKCLNLAFSFKYSLNLLALIYEKENLVIKTENNHKSYYELANEAKAYFICDVCHKVTNIDMPRLNVAKNIKSAVIKGVCDECDHE